MGDGVKASGMDRMRRVLSAMKMHEMVRLGAQMRQVNAARQEAEDLRTTARKPPVVESAEDLVVLDRWQQSLEQRAKAADAYAEAALAAAAPIGASLAKTLGREDVTVKLINKARAQMTQARDARAEDEATRPKPENQN